ncbi:MAG: HlyC/CorC family transporter [Thermoleophilia bacterium]|nr:HlyC/CorC family transporter [Thermoleophilia bacterium]
MDPLLVDLLLIVVLVTINGAFAGTELAVVTLRRSQLVRLAETEGRRGQVLLDLSERPTRFLSTIQVGITLAGFLASATAAVSLATPLEPVFAFLGGAARAVSIVLVTALLTFVTLVFGELVPKRVAMRRPEQWALRASIPVAMVARLATPLVWLLSRSTDLVARLVGAGGETARRPLTDEELLDVIATESEIAPSRRAIVEGAIELRGRTVREVLVPRRDVVVLDAELPVPDAIRELGRVGHSRAPVAPDGDLQHTTHVAVLGQLVDDSLQKLRVGEACAVEVTIVPDGALVQDVLRLLQQARRHMALVADERGTVLGIVTIEDLLEEIVGELYDELDRDLAPDDPRGYRRLPDGWFDLPGTYPVHDLPDLGLTVPADVDATTVAGLLMDALGALPVPGQRAQVGDVELVAMTVAGTVIERIRARGR